jgi:class 3 adenylate cyclase
LTGPRSAATLPGMSGIVSKSFEQPDETITFDHGSTNVLHVGSLAVGREVLDPGWRWSKHVKPIARTDRCEFNHVGYLLTGRLGFESRDGETREISVGDVYEVAPGHDAWVIGDEQVMIIEFQGVLDWAKAPEPGERILTSILFTDIVGSTATAERLGDKPWKQLLSTHHEAVRALLDMHRGHEVKTTGDGFLATFDAPARAITCALAISETSRALGIEVRAGVHTGEVEVSAGDLRGLAVHMAARIMDAAGPGEVLVSATSRELASGAGMGFVDRGSREFKGISGQRQIYQALPPVAAVVG